MFEKVMEYFSRKFVLALAALIGSFVLAWADKDIAGWVAAIATVLGFYSGANVLQHYADVKHGKPTSVEKLDAS